MLLAGSVETIEQLHSTGTSLLCNIRRQRTLWCDKERTMVKQILCILLFGAVATCTMSGCMIRNYNPRGQATYLWIPGVGEWPINDPLLNRNENHKRESDRELDEDS